MQTTNRKRKIEGVSGRAVLRYSHRKKIIIPAIVFAVLFILDRVSKILLLKYFSGIVSVNQGFAFGIGSNDSGGTISSLIVVIALISISIYFLVSGYEMLLPFATMLSGAVSNFIDRIIYGGVVDFINMKFWPTFNLADSFITIGVIWILLDLLFRKPKSATD